MRGFAIVSKGLEETAAKEIKEIINAECEIKEACVIFNTEKMIDLCRLAYLSQSIDRVLFLLGSYEFNDDFFDKMEGLVKSCGLTDWIYGENTFRVKCQRIGSHDFSSQHIEERTGEIILEQIGRHNVSLENPDAPFFVYVFNNSCYLGIDFTGFDMHKRDYHIFINPRGIRGTIAYSLLRMAGYTGKELLLDPFSGSGTIAIEAAIYATGFPVNFYNKDKFAFPKLKKLKEIDFSEFFREIDETPRNGGLNIYSYDSMLKNLLSAKKNAKIAGVDKKINFSRVDIEWLDTKFKEKSVDLAITHLPMITKAGKNEAKLYTGFFYQMEYILTEQGKIAALSNSEETLKKSAEQHGFAITGKNEVWSGKLQLMIYFLQKK